jgi:hypothetical protein
VWRPFQNVTDLACGADVLRRRAYGVIEVERGRLVRVRLRPWPKIVTVAAVLWSGERFHRRRRGDRAWLYYNQPRRFRNFLAVTYGLSTGDCSLATVRTALAVLDEIARIKHIDALLCDVTHSRLSERIMARFGWQPHKPQHWHRNFIKRFYGQYPPPLERPEYNG